MARKIKSTEEAAGAPTVEVPVGGVCFANNHPNRILLTGKGVPFKFSGTRQYFTNPDEIAVLKEMAKDPFSRIFQLDEEVIEEAPAVAEPVVAEEPVSEPESTAVENTNEN